jgi:hypothetical protein
MRKGWKKLSFDLLLPLMVVLTLGLQIRSYRADDRMNFRLGKSIYEFRSHRGKIRIGNGQWLDDWRKQQRATDAQTKSVDEQVRAILKRQELLTAKLRQSGQSLSLDEQAELQRMTSEVSRLLASRPVPAPGPSERIFFTLPYSALLLPVFLAFSIRAFRQARASTRTEQGRCTTCGYDMRATPGRCPECGFQPG